MSNTMQARMLARRAAEREHDETDQLVEVITDVIAEVFDDLLIEALKRQETRTAILNLVSGAKRPTSSTRMPVRAAAVKAGRRR